MDHNWFFSFSGGATCRGEARGFSASGLRAGVAQLVEQLIRNQQVEGSNPLPGFLISVKQYYFLGRQVSAPGAIVTGRYGDLPAQNDTV